MKARFLFSVLLVVMAALNCPAQTITQAEYFFDVDPGQGNGTPIAISPGVNITDTETISVASLQPGYHILFVRTRDSNGNWSLFEQQEFDITSPVLNAEYFFDVDPGFGSATPLPISTQSPTINETISIASLQPGYHLLFVRTQDALGNWSLVEVQEFVIESAIQQLEYFFDVDPGFGNATPLSITPGQFSITENIPTTSVSDGEHTLFIRTRHEDEWAQFSPVPVYVQTRIIEAEYFIDTDPGFGSGTSITIPTPNYLVTVGPTINVGALSNGNHQLFVRTRDILGVWSFFEPVMFTVDNLLPIGLKDFTAGLISNAVQLNWETFSEQDNDYFSVQHSADGQEFLEIAKVKGAGSSHIPVKYDHLHLDPADGTNYYRLKQVDFDGNAIFSEVVSVQLDKGGILVYPNPVEEEWFIEFSGETKGDNKIELFDAAGRKCLEATSEAATLSFRRNGLASGIYLLRVMTANGITSRKLVFR